MRHILSDDERAEAVDWFSPPFTWSVVKKGEIMRRWSVVEESPRSLLLMHGSSGAAATIELANDRATGFELLEGDEAAKLLRRRGFQISNDMRQHVRQHLGPGQRLDDALGKAFPRRIGLTDLGVDGHKHRFRIGAGGVVEIDAPNGSIRSHQLLTGGDALDAINEHDERKRWGFPPFPMNPIQVRTRGEAKLFAAVQKGDWEDARLKDGKLQALVRIPEGRRLFEFAVGDADDDGLGAGTSPCLDPTDFVLFAARIEKELPNRKTVPLGRHPIYATRLRQAASGLQQALRFIPEGADLPPSSGIYQTLPGQFYRQRNPDRFKRAHLQAEAKRLEALAAEWSA